MNAIDPAALANELVWLVLGTALLFPVLVLPAVQRLRGRGVGDAWLMVSPVLAALLPTLLGGLLLVGWADKEPADLKLAATSFGALRLGAWLTSLPLLFLSAIVLGFFAARESEERHWPAVGVAFGLMLLPALVLVGGAYTQGDFVFSMVRAALYAAMAVPIAVGSVGGRPSASLGLFPLVVAVGEASHRGMVVLLVAQQTVVVKAADWPEGVRQFYEAVAGTQLVGLVAVMVAVAVALGAALWDGRRTPSDAIAPILGAVGALVVAGAADIGAERMLALQALCLP